MKSRRAIFMFLILGLIIAPLVECGVKEIKASQLSRVVNPKNSAESQLQIRFLLEPVSQNAYVDHVELIIDQQIDLIAPEKIEKPSGLVNISGDQLMLAIYGVDAVSQSGGGQWQNWAAIAKFISANAALVPQDIVLSERARGRWENEAIRAVVTQFARARLKEQPKEILFVVGLSGSTSVALPSSMVSTDIAKLTARLMVHYIEPPVFPTHEKKRQ